MQLAKTLEFLKVHLDFKLLYKIRTLYRIWCGIVLFYKTVQLTVFQR